MYSSVWFDVTGQDGVDILFVGPSLAFSEVAVDLLAHSLIGFFCHL